MRERGGESVAQRAVGLRDDFPLRIEDGVEPGPRLAGEEDGRPVLGLAHARAEIDEEGEIEVASLTGGGSGSEPRVHLARHGGAHEDP
jgi:hypothetical protein